MHLLNNIPGIYRRPGPAELFGVILAMLSLFAGLLLVGTSAWFITTTALAGMGLAGSRRYNMFLPGAAIRCLAILRPLTKYKERVYTHHITLCILSCSRVWVFDRLFRLKKEDLIQFRSAELLNGLVADVDEMDHFYLGLILPWLSAGFAFLLAGIFFWSVLPCLLWLEAVAFLLAGLCIPWRAFKTAVVDEEKGIAFQQDLHTDLITLLTGFVELRIFGLLGRHRATIERLHRDREKNRRQSGIRLAGWVGLQQLVLQLCLVCAVLVIDENIDRIDGPLLVLIVLSLIALFETLQPLPALAHQFARTICAGGRLNRWLKDSGKERERFPVSPFPSVYSIALSQLSYSYGARVISYPSDFVFPAHAITVITGSNGTGKSTLLDLLSGLRVPAKGLITIGEVPLSCIDSNEWVSKVGYMEQRVILFQTSIYENIALAKPDATETEVREAAICAGLGRYLEQSPEFLQNPAGESGKKISGGQARMIGLARIILKDAPILLLDEPTEGLDALSEQLMIELIKSWKKHKTVILVTHKRSILSIADHQLSL